MITGNSRSDRWRSLVEEVSARPSRRPTEKEGLRIRGHVEVAGRSVVFESLHEQRFLRLCSVDYRVRSVLEQPLTIDYVDRRLSKARHYTPDFRVDLDDRRSPWGEQLATGTTVLVEIKDRRRLREGYDQLVSKYAAARLLCQRMGWRFLVLSERTLHQPLFANVSLFVARDYRADARALARIRQALTDLGDLPIGTLLAQHVTTGVTDAEMQAAIFSMMLRGELYVSLRHRVTKDTLVSLAKDG